MADLIDPVVTYPLPLSTLRTFLLSRAEIAALVGTRISDTMPSSSASPRWPALRLYIPRVNLDSPGRINSLIQVDCWALNQPSADRLASKVSAVLKAVRQYETDDALLDHVSGVGWETDPDESVTPPQPRSRVTGRIWLQPHNP